jgi:diguanylate cyclase (GGDEF)-like protein
MQHDAKHRATPTDLRWVSHRWAALAVGLSTVVYVVWTQTELGGVAVTRAFSDISIGVAAAAAGFAAVAAWRRQAGWPGRSWLLIGIGMLAWALGEAIWTTYEVFLAREVPFPSSADAGFLLLYPFALVGLVAMLDFHRRALRTLFDSFMVAGSLLYVSWPLVLEPTYQAGGQGLFARSIALAYPIGDIILATMAFVLLSQLARQTRGTLALTGAGMLGLAVADSGFAYLTTHGAYASASVIDPGWFVGFLVIALAAWRLRGAAAAPRRREAAPLLVALPYVPLAAAMVTSIVVEFTRGSMGVFLYVTLMILVVLVVLRQLLTLRENLALTRALRNLAFHDPLTGLANRSLLHQRTELAVERQRREQDWVGVLYVDLDDFKQVNDQLGHLVGDALLVEVAGRLRRCVRPPDTVARLGGDEFAVLLDGLAAERDAMVVGQRIVAALAEPCTLDNHTVRISASVGVAIQRQGAGPDLLRQADAAMYDAKLGGKNGLVCFDPGLRAA